MGAWLRYTRKARDRVDTDPPFPCLAFSESRAGYSTEEVSAAVAGLRPRRPGFLPLFFPAAAFGCLAALACCWRKASQRLRCASAIRLRAAALILRLRRGAAAAAGAGVSSLVRAGACPSCRLTSAICSSSRCLWASRPLRAAWSNSLLNLGSRGISAHCNPYNTIAVNVYEHCSDKTIRNEGYWRPAPVTRSGVRADNRCGPRSHTQSPPGAR